MQPDNSVVNNTAKSWYGWTPAVHGIFGFQADPGSYQIQMITYPNGVWTLEPGPKCVVPLNGNVVCNANLPATNFTAKMLNSSGKAISDYTMGEIAVWDGKQANAACCTWAQGLNTFNYQLLDGSYQFRVVANQPLIDGFRTEILL
jgi:hypothetical protein